MTGDWLREVDSAIPDDPASMIWLMLVIGVLGAKLLSLGWNVAVTV